jgi:two-component system, OmpR family, KDP operon response regulator KdpE
VKGSVLIIDDEVQIRRLLRTALEAQEWRTHEADNGARGLQAAVFARPDFILLDLGLPDLDGLEVLRRLREWSEVPVIVLSVREAEATKVAALELGADDYVTKPFSPAELLARLSAIRRRQQSGAMNSATWQLGPLAADWAARSVTAQGAPVHLTPTEFALFKILARHAGKVVLQSQLLREVWGQQAAEQGQYLRVYITHLRRKLGLTPTTNVRLTNEPGVGYRLEEKLGEEVP